jgi:catechol 2,3-dioxygenase-like lactoylglutathione lyase family enzyme
MSIIGMHTIMFGDDADRIRAFLRDVLELPEVDAGGGWPVFKAPPSELAAHASSTPGHYELYLMCDDLDVTMAELERKGVEFTADVRAERWGLITAIAVPGGGELGLYEPRHPTAI